MKTHETIADEREAVTYRNQPGDAAKLREALSDACYAMFNFLKTQNGGYEEMANALDKAKAALAASPRNCDRMNVDDAFSAFSFMCDNTDCRDCPYKKNNKFGDSELCAMLFLYDNGNGGKEGGDDEQK